MNEKRKQAIIDLINPEKSSIVSEVTAQSSLGDFGVDVPVSSKHVSSKVPSVELQFSKVPVKSVDVLPDNSFAFKNSQSSIVEVVSENTFPERSSVGPEKRLVLSSDYMFSDDGVVVRKNDFSPVVDVLPVSKRESFGSGAVSLLDVGYKSDVSLRNKSVLGLRQSSSDVLLNKKVVDNVQVISPVVDVFSEVGLKTNVKVLQLQSLSQDVVQESSNVQSVKSILDLKQSPSQDVVQESSQLSKGEDFVKPIVPKVLSNRQVRSGSGRFSVIVKKAGKPVVIGSGYSDLATAFNRGKQEVKDTARASFKVVSDLGVVQKVNFFGDRTLRASKVDSSFVVQKREFRISSAGEKREISRKGISSQRTGKLLNKKNRGVFG
jgi:hypothetical protein